MDRGDNVGAAQAFIQATTVALAYAIGATYGLTTKLPLDGLSLVFQQLGKGSASDWTNFKIGLLKQTGLLSSAGEARIVASLGAVGSSFAGGAAMAYGINSFIDTINSFNLGFDIYDALHPNVISNVIGNTPDPLVKTIRYVDPLILDLDGNGLEITPLSKAPPVLFDADGDTVRTATAWAGPNDGMLVLDRNNNGVIDSGAELFGDETVLGDGKKAANGFAALAELDTNGDGIFSAADSQFGAVRVWRDLNQDGISQDGELKTLADSGIQSIGLAHTPLSKSYGDAILTQDGTFTRSDGSTGEAGSFILAQNSFVREFAPIAVSDEAKALPNLGGSGWVRDFQEAATQSPELIAIEQRAENATTRAGYKTAVADLLRAWGDDSAYNSASKQALAQGYGLILSDPQDDQERSWLDVAVKGASTDREAFRATLTDGDRTKFDAMRERMVGGLEKLEAYEAFTGFTFLSWPQVQSDTFAWSPRALPGGRIPIVVEVPLSQLLAQERNAVSSSEAGYIRVTIPQPPVGMPHIDTLWNRLVDDASANLLPALRLAKYAGLVDINFFG